MNLLGIIDVGKTIGTIREEQLQFLIDQLKEENLDDRGCLVTPLFIAVVENEDREPGLAAM